VIDRKLWPRARRNNWPEWTVSNWRRGQTPASSTELRSMRLTLVRETEAAHITSARLDAGDDNGFPSRCGKANNVVDIAG
jgi:hypothetical protein